MGTGCSLAKPARGTAGAARKTAPNRNVCLELLIGSAIRDGSTVTPFPPVMLKVKVSVCRLSACYVRSCRAVQRAPVRADLRVGDESPPAVHCSRHVRDSPGCATGGPAPAACLHAAVSRPPQSQYPSQPSAHSRPDMAHHIGSG